MNLTYRKINYEKDIDELIDLLRTSLSERQTSKLFLWKHFENPFGKSYGLLAIDNDKIVGARMFMFWEFSKGQETIRAIRPVDTITHPAYRGKGIFKKLTLKGLEDCRKDYDIIFNTPNKNSYPGYIKMGWEDLPGSLNFKIGLFNPFIGSAKTIHHVEIRNIDLGDIILNQNGNWSTKISKDFLIWRYENENYKILSLRKDETIKALVIYNIQKIKGIKVIVLIEFLGNRAYQKMAIQKIGGLEKTFLVYYLENLDNEKINLIFSFKRTEARVVVKDDSKNIRANMQFSIGDLEGRL